MTTTFASMSASERAAAEPAYTPKAITEPVWLKILLITIALAFSLLFLLIPLAVVFTEAFRKGWQTYLDISLFLESLFWESQFMAESRSLDLHIEFGFVANNDSF